MKKVQAQQDLFGDSAYIVCLVWLPSHSYHFAVGHHHRQDEAEVGAVEGDMVEMVQQCHDMFLAGMFVITGVR